MESKFLPLFPFAKIGGLCFLYLLAGDRSIFQFSISFISISFLIRLVSGNTFAMTKKMLGDPRALASYRAVCIVAAAFFFVGFIAARLLASGFDLALLLASMKLTEAALSSIFFEMKNVKARGLSGIFLYIGALAVIFLAVTSSHGIIAAIELDVLLMAFMVIFLRGYFTKIKNPVPFLGQMFANNIEIMATVLPTSLFVLWGSHFSEQTQLDIELLGSLSLALSVSGFIARPVSLWASRLGAVSYGPLFWFSHCVALLAFFLAFVHGKYGLPYFEIAFSCMFIFCTTIQNFIRINIFANSKVSLLRIHFLEAALVLTFILFGFTVLHGAMVLILTRTARLAYISFLMHFKKELFKAGPRG